MTTPNRSLSPSRSHVMTTGLVFVLAGIASTWVARPLDGFVGGLFIGAGIMLILLGVYLLGRITFRKDHAGPVEDGWLPSQDGDR